MFLHTHLVHNHDTRFPCDLLLLIFMAVPVWQVEKKYHFLMNHLYMPSTIEVLLIVLLDFIFFWDLFELLSTTKLTCITYSQFLYAVWFNYLVVQTILMKINYITIQIKLKLLLPKRQHPLVHWLWWVIVINNYSPLAIVYKE